MADISALSNLQATDPLDDETYVDAREFPPPPPKGRYIFRAPEKFIFGATKAGHLSAKIDPTIVGPAAEGTVVKSSVSAKTYKRQGIPVSQLGDYRRACGLSAAGLTQPQQQAEAVEETAGRTFQADGDWQAYCKVCKYTLNGMKNFPSDGNGGYSPWTTCPNCKDDKGAPINLKAWFVLDRFVSASA